MAQGLDLIWMVISFLLLQIHLSSQQETSFIFNCFRQGDLHVDGVAQILPGGLLQLTNTSEQKMGHAFFKQPFEFNSSESLSFSTHFVCAMVRKPGITGGNGIAFFLSPTMNLSEADATQYLGLFNTTTNRSPSARIFAVELDTVQSAEFDDINNNHVGVNVNSLTSNVSAPATYFSDKEDRNKTINLLSGDSIQVWVDYDGTLLNVSLSPLGAHKPPSQSLISISIDLSEILQGRMFVGFTAATGQLANNHYILGWSFSRNKQSLQSLNISKLPNVPHPKKKVSPVLILLLILLGIIVLVLLGGAYLYRRNKYAEVREEWEKEYGPHRYSYKTIYKATRGFHKDGFLGKGGFGEVYKGTLPNDGDIAVKRFSHDGERGMKQFVAEIASMGRLDHRNLVPLLGYCRRKGEFFLISKYMPNGSLDQFLFHNRGGESSSLPWTKRFWIIKGIASALCYLHKEAAQVVLHRDIKASNVMLDSEFNGRLGDFGMARYHEHGANPTMTGAVGTMGYMAPELTSMGASTRTDVYAFGAFLLEVACGRRPVEVNVATEKQFLVRWVCECWRRNDLLKARDPKLSSGGESFSSSRCVELVMKVGLLCTNLVPEERPEMERVVQYLEELVPLPEFSPETPGIGILSSVMVGGSSSNGSAPATESMFITHSIQYGEGR
ncbi:unnamed protein product [Eruca vesicaria subsp. sativa]|uniref:non-specific serine/threonine protein kinase n=1 Tax=Eruca vesicaria subsp. sativa TaxID=29727 RepID=A0ABC8JDL6_ERUVS|nr:unnamed protein product [Eruca vesicaria subsp. sativa]